MSQRSIANVSATDRASPQSWLQSFLCAGFVSIARVTRGRSLFAVLLLVLVCVSTASASLLPHREVPACERAAPQLDEFAIAARLGDTEPCFGRYASTEMLMRPRMARGVVDANFHGESEPPNGRDRLIQAQPNAPNEAIVEYQYDADDRRIARIATPRINGVPQAPITTLYVFDNSTLLHEANLAGITDTYRRSAKLDRHIAHQTNTVRHYQLDALDTPVAMTDASGATVNATTFDAWGNPTQQTASGSTTVPWQVPNYNPLISGQAALLNNDNQSIGFTGYQKDAAAGLYYAGARFYDPLIGGFSGMDPAAGMTGSPVTFHRYLYGNGNPLIYIDPSGRIALLADGANMIASWNGWLSEQTTQLDSGAVGGSVSFGVGIGRGLLMLTEGAVRGVNVGVNVGVLASASAVSTFTGTAPEYAEGAAGELMGIHAAANAAVDFVRDDGVFKAYDAAVIRTSDAIQGDNQAISDITAALTTLAAPVAARGTTGTALTQNIQQRAQAAYESARNAAAARVQSLRNAVRKPAVMTESANGPAQPRFNDIDSEFSAVNQPPLYVESGQPGLLRNTQTGQFIADPFATPKARPAPTGNRNARSTQEPTIFYRIDVDGQGRKVGISSEPPTSSGDYTRPMGQVRKLEKHYGSDVDVEYRVRKRFANRSDALDYENVFLERFKRLYGEYPGEQLPGGNRTNR
ncbi:MAG: RHS domain-containing protein [Xanthomonadales bacterium]|nr:RHS domain-containing protein [Xanthomonadales bacterium]